MYFKVFTNYIELCFQMEELGEQGNIVESKSMLKMVDDMKSRVSELESKRLSVVYKLVFRTPSIS
jgi:hypothetical protein